MIYTGARLIKVKAADGAGVSWCVPAGGVSFENGDGETETLQYIRTGDRFILAETADGHSVPVRVIPSASSGDRGVAGKTSDGYTVLVNPWNTYEYEECTWDETEYTYEYEECTWDET